MKTLLIALVLFANISIANPSNRKPSMTLAKTEQEVSLENQLTAYLNNSVAFQQSARQGVALLVFRVNAQNRITDLDVQSGNENLNQRLHKQLAGKKLNGLDTERPGVYQVRVSYRTNG